MHYTVITTYDEFEDWQFRSRLGGICGSDARLPGAERLLSPRQNVYAAVSRRIASVSSKHTLSLASFFSNTNEVWDGKLLLNGSEKGAWLNCVSSECKEHVHCFKSNSGTALAHTESQKEKALHVPKDHTH